MAAAATFDSRDFTVLLVNSDQHARGELGSQLRRGGYQTRDFGRAIDLLAAPSHIFRWSCVLSELSLPDMTSVDLVRNLRDRAIRIPVIVLTGQADVRTAVEALRNDVSDFLLKPVAEHDLLQRIETALARYVRQAQAVC